MAGLVSLLRSIPLSPLASRALSLSGASPLLRLRPLVAAVRVGFSLRRNPVRSGLRCFSTRPTTSSLNDPSPNWSNQPPKEAILLNGCDFEHLLDCCDLEHLLDCSDFEYWLVVLKSSDLMQDVIIQSFLIREPPDPSLMRDKIIDGYIKNLGQGLRSEDEARISIYSVSTKHYFAFDCKVFKEISYKIKPLSKVRRVPPDSYLDVKNKDYGGEPFIDGKTVPYDPKYHEEWSRNNARAQERSRRNDRPHNFDRSRNFERRRENMQNFQNREAPPVQNQDFPSQNTTQHTSQATPPVRDGATPNFQNQPPPNYQNQMPPNTTAIPNYQNQTPPNSTAVPNQQGGYIPNHQGGSRGYQGGPGGPGQVNPGGYQGGSFATPPTYQGGSSARPGSHTGYQGGSPSDYQGGGSPPTAYPGGCQGGAPAYQGGSPVGRQVFNQPFQGQGVSSGYPPPNSRYQGGSQNNQQGGERYQGGSPVYPGRDLPGRDQ